MERLKVPEPGTSGNIAQDYSHLEQPRKRSVSIPDIVRQEVDDIIAYVEEALTGDQDTTCRGTPLPEEQVSSTVPFIDVTSCTTISDSSKPDVRTSSSQSDYGSIPTPLSERNIEIKTQTSVEDNSDDTERIQSRPLTANLSERTNSPAQVTSDERTDDIPQHCTSDRVTINVGGQRFVTYKSTLQNIPKTKLSRLNEQDPSFDPVNNEYFFDRNPRFFESILDFYRTGTLHFMHCLCGPAIKQELDFWHLDEHFVSPCCWRAYKTYEDQQATLKVLEKVLEDHPRDVGEKDPSICNKRTCQWRQKIWLFMDKPFSSKKAQIWAIFIFLLILTSIVNVCLETHPFFRVSRSEESLGRSTLQLNTTNPKRIMYHETEPHPVLWYIEALSVFIFNGELFVRFICCPHKLHFFRSVFNIIDIFCVIPMLIVFVLELSDPLFWDTQQFFLIITYVSLTSVLRVFRLFKLARHYRSLKILQLAVKSSLKELILLFLLITMGMLIFSTLIYFAEFEEENNFEHIPIGFWWSIVTMTTVGYGDIHPQSGPGYLVGAVCTIAGMLATGLPIPIIASNFNHYYNFARFKSKLRQRSIKKRESGMRPGILNSQQTDFFKSRNRPSNVCIMCGSHRIIRSVPRSPRNRVIPQIRLENT